MGEARRNKLGGLSLAAAVLGFLAVELQPWLPLSSASLFGGLTLKALLEAFFEASMAGAFADWFAVSALFRDPLGVKLPHTNILAKSKDAIASALPRFLSGFVSSEVLASELRKADFASKLADELVAGGAREGLHDFLRRRAGELLRAYGEGRDEARARALEGFVGQVLDFASAEVDAPETLRGLLSWAKEEGFDQAAVEALAEYVRLEVGRNRGRIVGILTPMIKRNAGWKGLFINSGTVEGFVLGIEDELAEMKSDRRNELRRFVLEAVAGFADRLDPCAREGSADREAVAAAFREAAGAPAFREGLAQIARELASKLGDDLAGEDGRFIPALERIEDALVARLKDDEEFRARFNETAASLAVGVIERGKLVEGAAEYLAGLIKATDDEVFVGRIEEAVWNDLQYIRLNGAVVGGFVGLVVTLVKAALRG